MSDAVLYITIATFDCCFLFLPIRAKNGIIFYFVPHHIVKIATILLVVKNAYLIIVDVNAIGDANFLMYYNKVDIYDCYINKITNIRNINKKAKLQNLVFFIQARNLDITQIPKIVTIKPLTLDNRDLDFIIFDI